MKLARNVLDILHFINDEQKALGHQITLVCRDRKVDLVNFDEFMHTSWLEHFNGLITTTQEAMFRLFEFLGSKALVRNH